METSEALDSSLFEELDENGFLLSDFLCEEVAEGAGMEGNAGHESFAEAFYRSGSDWSCLVQEDLSDLKPEIASSSSKKVVQADLFKLWGLKKPVQSKNETKLAPSRKRTVDLESIDDQSGRKLLRSSDEINPNSNQQRTCPFYKKIHGTPFTVDAFRYGLIEGCAAYFLSHFHYDHYGGLSKKWSHGPIYCTHLTARLVKLSLSVNPRFICPMELDTEYIIEGVKVTMLEANHCPGAALIHFRLKDGRCYLHTGDFRACREMQSHPLLMAQMVNVLYLDTTYCNPKYRFPLKEDVVNFVVRITKSSVAKQPKTLIVVGAYSIGKEHVYLAISEALGVQIYVDSSRKRILQSYGWSGLDKRLCSDGKSTPLHVLPISSLHPERLKKYLEAYRHQYLSVLAFRPTGWTFSEKIGSQLDLIKPNSKGNITIYGVPYSEHSSFTELRDFVQFLRPEKIIPTVNVGKAAARDQMHSHFREWLKA
ncbi:DNA cross-link repair protein SNM1 [Amborella trichopoda]|uniref:Metallo-beta-lactamase domain-containing protein n=1 Tax=Amborella trichopoda TaxID=13333 RepID=W1PEH9_AMBTC|nr:DNA cross-link repair protein SNM1 [Amborella trichopoda]ERN06358.1 hypothetical protein AMTR_s00016p00244350 [Amborella trichopoda]|eukprot:XP_006844683.1 DNA cross-link repair protein SNM1 [Amborella trichopoda]